MILTIIFSDFENDMRCNERWIAIRNIGLSLNFSWYATCKWKSTTNNRKDTENLQLPFQKVGLRKKHISFIENDTFHFYSVRPALLDYLSNKKSKQNSVIISEISSFEEEKKEETLKNDTKLSTEEKDHKIIESLEVKEIPSCSTNKRNAKKITRTRSRRKSKNNLSKSVNSGKFRFITGLL